MKLVPVSAALALLATAALAQTDPAAPKGKLPDAAMPTAYRLQLTVLPDQPRFSGHVEIDAIIKAPTAHLYMHGNNLAVSRAVAMVGGKPMTATWTQVDPTGVVRLDFPTPLPAGPVTLAFDYDAAFGDSPSGMYHIKVARPAGMPGPSSNRSTPAPPIPSFDEPGFKTPFTVSITTTPGLKTVSNAPEASVTSSRRAGDASFRADPAAADLSGRHGHRPVRPSRGFRGRRTPQRASRCRSARSSAQAQADKLDYVLAETPRIVELLEDYFGQPFPFPKLDQIGSPEMPGAMENAGADTYADDIIELDSGATTGQRQTFGMVVGA